MCVGFSGLDWSPEQGEYKAHTHVPGPKAGVGSPPPRLLPSFWRWAEFQPLQSSFHVLTFEEGAWKLTTKVMWLDESSLCTWEIVCQDSGLSLHPHIPSHTWRPERKMNLHRSHMPVRLCCDMSDGSDWRASCNFGREQGHGECECAMGGRKSATDQWCLMKAGGGRASNSTQITELQRTVIILAIKI